MNTRLISILVLGGSLLVAGCGGTQQELAAAGTSEAEAAAQQASQEAARKAAEADAAAAAAARDAQVALQESELRAKEADLAAREAQLAKASAARSAPAKTASKPAAKPVVLVKPAPKVLTLPAGTSLRFALASEVSTKTAKVGDSFQASLISDAVVDGKVAVPAGAIATGTVTHAVSGSDKIGAVPALGLRVNTLEYGGGKTVPVNGEISSTGKSEKGRDAAKIAGGAAAGAVIGRQVNDKDSGTIIGGLLGAAAGTLAARKTGTEAVLPAGSEITVLLAEPITVQLN
jgi:Glycine zipper 2TM domain